MMGHELDEPAKWLLIIFALWPWIELWHLKKKMKGGMGQ